MSPGDELGAVLDALRSRELLTGLGWGLATAAVLAFVVARRRHERPVGAGGLAVAVAGVAGLASAISLPWFLVTGLVLLGLGGLAADRADSPVLVRAGLALPGAIVLALDPNLPSSPAERMVAAGAVVAGGALVASFDARWPRLGPGLLVLSALGVWAVVAETGPVLVVAGAAAPVAVLAGPLGRVTLGRTGALLATGLLVWAAATGAVFGLGSLLGALGTLGLLAVEPLVRATSGRRHSPLDAVPPGWRPVVAGAVHLVMVLVSARVAGLRRDPGPAAAILAVTFVVVFCLGLAAVAVAARRATTND